MKEHLIHPVSDVETNFFGYIHQSRDKENISVESLRARAGISRSTADKVRNSLVEKKLIGKNNKFFGKHSCYIGIAVYSKYIDISACGLDGKTISLEERFSSNVRLKLEDYSIDGFVKVTEVIRNIITTINLKNPVKGVCFSFEDVDKGKGLIYFSKSEDYFKSVGYSFENYIKSYFSDYFENIMFFLQNNAMSNLLAHEYPFFKHMNDRVYVLISDTGVYLALIEKNILKYGYNNQTINISPILTVDENNKMIKGTLEPTEIFEIYKKIIIALMPFSPEVIVLSQYEENIPDGINTFLLKSGEFFQNWKIRQYYPEFQIDIANVARGAAVYALYKCYGWKENMF